MTTVCTLVKNGHSYTTKALIDSGANSFVLIDKLFLYKLIPFLKPFTAKLKKPLYVKGYNSLPGATIECYIFLILIVDNRTQSFTPFLITYLGSHNIILGHSWLAENRILLDYTNRKLHWPADLPPTFNYTNNFDIGPVLEAPNMINLDYQHDILRYEEKMEHSDNYQQNQPAFFGGVPTILRYIEPIAQLAEVSKIPADKSARTRYTAKTPPKDPYRSDIAKIQKELKMDKATATPPRRRPKPL
jgi:hypothetical protein